jgi:hypothetical protein
MSDDSLFDIDMNQLHTAWLSQPKRYHDAAMELAEARAEWEYSKTRRDVLLAELQMKIRRDPEVYGLSKPTDKSVEATLTALPQYTKIENAVTDAKHKVDVCQAHVDALDHRKKALENLVQLEGRDYFSTPRVPKGAESKVREKVQKAERDRAFRSRKGSA